MARFTYYADSDTPAYLCSVSTAKKLLKERMKSGKTDGTAWTDHFDRDGSFQESTPVIPGNNAGTTYRAKYNTSKCYNR